MVQVGRTKTRLHSDLAERDTHSKSHPALYIEGGLGIKNVYVGYTTREALGDQVISGLGFQPSVVVIFAKAIGGTHQILSQGWADGTRHGCVALRGDQVDTVSFNDRLAYCHISGSGYLSAVLKSFDADGFTLTWSGVLPANVIFTYLAMR